MNYIDEIFTRLNIQQLREFLMHGGECAEISHDTYRQRIKSAWEPLTGILKKNFPEFEEYEKMTSEIFAYTAVTENVYMEIGIQCGAMLVMQLFMRPCP